jgi:hypothetical protein
MTTTNTHERTLKQEGKIIYPHMVRNREGDTLGKIDVQH